MSCFAPCLACAVLLGSAGSAAAWTASPDMMDARGGRDTIEVEARQTGPGCPTLPGRSPFTGKRASVYFQNRNGTLPLKIYWIDGVGNWQFKEDLAPGKSTTFGTIIGARWVLVDPTGRCVQTPIVNIPSTTVVH